MNVVYGRNKFNIRIFGNFGGRIGFGNVGGRIGLQVRSAFLQYVR